jgi:hypothetical protein
MAVTTQRFKITWMVCTTFAQFERMVAMTILVTNRLMK